MVSLAEIWILLFLYIYVDEVVSEFDPLVVRKNCWIAEQRVPFSITFVGAACLSSSGSLHRNLARRSREALQIGSELRLDGGRSICMELSRLTWQFLHRRILRGMKDRVDHDLG